MYRAGHVGIALLVYVPVGLGLLAGDRPDLALLGWAGMVGLATVPDVDHRIPFVKHRGFSHTVWFGLLVGLTLGVCGWVVGGRPDVPTSSELAVFGFAIGSLSVGAHLLGDVITPMGIKPFWPVWNRHFTARLTTAKNAVANYAFLALGVFVTAASLVTLLGTY